MLFVVPPLLAALASFFARWSWFCELACHFRAQGFLSVLAGTLLLLMARRWRSALAVSILVAFYAGALWPLYAPREPSAPGGRALRIVSFNVHSTNRQYELVLSYIRALNPDVAVFCEVNEPWSEALQTLAADWPYYRIEPSPGNFGIALFSRLPLQTEAGDPATDDRAAASNRAAPDDAKSPASALEHAIRLERLTDGCPALVARLAVEGTPVAIVGAHVYPPIPSWAAARRDAQLARLAEVVRKEPAPCVVVGDLNTTLWSPAFVDFVRQTGLRDTRLGLGVQPSWPSGLPAPLRIPIDHCLASPALAVRHREIGPDMGSDHLPVVVDLVVPPP